MRFFTVLFFVLFSLLSHAGEATKPNFVFVLVDDLGEQVHEGYRAVWHPHAAGDAGLYPRFEGTVVTGPDAYGPALQIGAFAVASALTVPPEASRGRGDGEGGRGGTPFVEPERRSGCRSSNSSQPTGIRRKISRKMLPGGLTSKGRLPLDRGVRRSLPNERVFEAPASPRLVRPPDPREIAQAPLRPGRQHARRRQPPAPPHPRSIQRSRPTTALPLRAQGHLR